MAHPIPWSYKSNYSSGKSAILDKDGKVVVYEGQVSNVVFDMIWAVYCQKGRTEQGQEVLQMLR